MEKFAKLFEFDDIGQVLVMLDVDQDDDEKPEIKFYFKPEGLGVCSVGTVGTDSWEIAERRFNLLEADRAHAVVKAVIDQLNR